MVKVRKELADMLKEEFKQISSEEWDCILKRMHDEKEECTRTGSKGVIVSWERNNEHIHITIDVMCGLGVGVNFRIIQQVDCITHLCHIWTPTKIKCYTAGTRETKEELK